VVSDQWPVKLKRRRWGRQQKWQEIARTNPGSGWVGLRGLRSADRRNQGCFNFHGSNERAVAASLATGHLFQFPWDHETAVAARSARVCRPRRSADRRSPGDAPTIGTRETCGQRGRAGQETLPEPARRGRAGQETLPEPAQSIREERKTCVNRNFAACQPRPATRLIRQRPRRSYLSI